MSAMRTRFQCVGTSKTLSNGVVSNYAQLMPVSSTDPTQTSLFTSIATGSLQFLDPQGLFIAGNYYYVDFSDVPPTDLPRT